MVWCDAVAGSDLHAGMSAAFQRQCLDPLPCGAGAAFFRLGEQEERVRIRDAVETVIRQGVRIGQPGAGWLGRVHVLQGLLYPCNLPAVGDEAVFDDHGCKGGEGGTAFRPVFLCRMAERLAAGLVEVIVPESLYGLVQGHGAKYGVPHKVEVLFRQFPFFPVHCCHGITFFLISGPAMFPAVLAGNFHMVVLKHPPAFGFQAVAAVIRELPDVRLGAGEGEDVLHPAVCLLAGEYAVFPDGVKHPVRFDPFVPQVAVCQHPLGLHGPHMDTHIGVAFRVAGADIKVFIQRLFLIYIRCLPEYGAASAVGAFDPCRCVPGFLFHSYTPPLPAHGGPQFSI